MGRFYTVEIERLPLPATPLSEGHLQRSPKISVVPDRYGFEPDALRRARDLIQEGYGISISTPDGKKITHEQVLQILNG